eukprot:GHVS01094290.1.p1 GENE.GHVS01094290.1~~GHVS01094290.1.p1  ORF type:complete len:400 (+),score=70.29 GHVS01094290.1:243-1442(+)
MFGRMLKFIEIPADVSDPLICCNTRLDSLKLSLDPAYFIPTLLRKVSAMTEGGGTSSGPTAGEGDDGTTAASSSETTGSSGTGAASGTGTATANIGTGGLGWGNILPFPTYNEWQGNNSPLIFMRRGKEGQRNKRAEILLDTMNDKMGSKRKVHCYGNVVVFWRKYVDESKHQMKLSDFSVEDLKLICPNMFPSCPSSPVQPAATHSYAAALNVSASCPSGSLQSPPKVTASSPVARRSPLPQNTATTVTRNLVSSQSTKDCSAVVSTFLESLAQKLPDVKEAVNSLFSQDAALREEIRRLEAELVAAQNRNDQCLSELLVVRDECENLRKSVKRLPNQLPAIETHLQSSPEPEQVKNEEAKSKIDDDQLRAGREKLDDEEIERACVNATDAADGDRVE